MISKFKCDPDSIERSEIHFHYNSGCPDYIDPHLSSKSYLGPQIPILIQLRPSQAFLDVTFAVNIPS